MSENQDGVAQAKESLDAAVSDGVERAKDAAHATADDLADSAKDLIAQGAATGKQAADAVHDVASTAIGGAQDAYRANPARVLAVAAAAVVGIVVLVTLIVKKK